LNTASPEVLRTLPHMSRLISNDREQWPVTDPDGDDVPYWIATVNPGPERRPQGDLLANGKPNPDSDSVNPQWTRIPESIVRYRDGDGTLARVNPRADIGDAGDDGLALPAYLDRGSVAPQGTVPLTSPLFPEGSVDASALSFGGSSGFFPGMRRNAGIASTGELLLLQRPALNGGFSLRERSSPSIFGLLGDPYARQNLSSRALTELEQSDVAPEQCNLGWRPRFDDDLLMQADARLATDRTNIRWDAVVEDIPTGDFDDSLDEKAPPEFDMEIPDSVAGDAEEAYLLFSGISNLVSVRSDTFTAYIQIKSFKQNPVTGIWDAMDPEFLVDDSRYVFQIDRSNCQRPSDAPLIRMLNKVPSSIGVSGN
ncbi:MAG: hypothetical protein GY895_10805, partial [Phycisphaera sp.]|nr:hypothetical protein [Phycisphaera sp.]